jgi:hypothetical protein
MHRTFAGLHSFWQNCSDGIGHLLREVDVILNWFYMNVIYQTQLHYICQACQEKNKKFVDLKMGLVMAVVFIL